MKKLFISLLSVLLSFVFVFAACGEQAVTPDTPDTPSGGTGDEYTLELEEGCRQLTIYYNRAAGYTNCDIWLWYDGADGRGYVFHECDYGAKVVVNVPDTVEEVGYIIRTGCSDPGGTSWGTATKDGTDNDRSVTLDGVYTVIYTKAGDANNYKSDDGGKTLEIMKFITIADLQTLTKIKVYLSDASSRLVQGKVTVKDGDGKSVAISSVSNNVVTLSESLDISKSYTLEAEGFDPVTVVPLTYMNGAEFAELYTYDGELGVELTQDSTTFRLWAPTASSVKLNIFATGNGGTAEATYNLTRGEKGVWTYNHPSSLNGKYYTYTVSNSSGVQEAVDPYARSAGLNGQRGMILDLDSTDPEGWTNVPFDNPAVENYTDAEIWEVHVRDFSNKIESSQYKGKYLAFTETGLTNENGLPVGVDYLKELGITHVHLLPSFDYASVDEASNTQFNWGYDPQNYNVPEGSYSTNPYDGAVRVNEYKQMVQALHDAGISVVMDVVYNHTYALDSNLNKIVPYYYYRYTYKGVPSNGSGCGNETASECSMVRKYIVDSIKYWQSEYNLDGFRFDLMAIHDIDTMKAVEQAVHEVNPEALIYGEGWTGGTSELTSNQAASLANLKKLNEDNPVNGVAMFNDVLRDAIKGSVFDIEDTGFATGARASYLGKVLFGVQGAVNKPAFYGTGVSVSWFADNPTNVINYASAHDNNTLWDRICAVHGTEASTLDLRIKRNNLSAAIVQTSLGIPFMQAGEEMLRTKTNADGSYNENSYNSPDSVNNLDWASLSSTSSQYAVMQYYKGLIAFRKSCETLRMTSAVDSENNPVCEIVAKDGAFVAFTVTNPETGEKVLVVYNAKTTASTFTLPSGSWNLYINGETAGDQVILSDLSGEQTVTPVSCYVYKLDVKA
ncbi:MAG: type I pullulanase [Candidatus Coproplasma sp.]